MDGWMDVYLCVFLNFMNVSMRQGRKRKKKKRNDDNADCVQLCSCQHNIIISNKVQYCTVLQAGLKSMMMYELKNEETTDKKV